MLRPQILAGVRMTLVFTVLCGLAYPLVVYGIGQVAFHDRVNGSLVSHNGHVVGSSLIGQTFLDKDGNPDLHYFQPRPSAAGTGYDALSSSASNLGPGAEKLIAECLPVPATDSDGNPVVDAAGNPVNQTNADGTPVCDPTTVPQRVLAYRAAYGLADDQTVPVDAVTASGSGLDPDISVANAILQAPTVAKTTGVSLDKVLALVHDHTTGRTLGVLGEKVVNVLELNLALDTAQGR